MGGVPYKQTKPPKELKGKLLGYPQSLAHRSTNGCQRAFFGRAMGDHAVMVDSNRQPMLRVRPAQTAAGPVMAESQRVAAHGAHAGTTREVEASDSPMMGSAVHRIVIAGGTGYMEGPHPVFRKKAHAIQLTAIGQHSVEPGFGSAHS